MHMYMRFFSSFCPLIYSSICLFYFVQKRAHLYVHVFEKCAHLYLHVYLQKYADVHLLLMYMYVLRNVLTHMYVYCTRACTDLETHRGKIENTHVYVHAYLLRMHLHIYCTCIFTAHARVQIWKRTAGRLRTYRCFYVCLRYIYCTRACTDMETDRGKIENIPVYIHAYLLRMHMHIYCTRVCTDMETDRGKIENIPVFPMCCDYCHKACMSMSHHLVPCHIILYCVTSYQCFQCAATTATRHEKVKEKTKF